MSNIADDDFATYKFFAREFKSRGYEVAVDIVNRKRFVTYTAPNGETWHTFASNITYPFANREAKLTSIQKEKAYELAEKLHVQIPHTRFIDEGEKLSTNEAADLLAHYKKLIVKPSNSSLSKGLTLNITNQDELTAAIEHARTINQGVIIQEQVEGEEVRFAIVKGKAIAALLRRTARVIGDGRSTVAQLLELENEARKKLVFEHVVYPQLTSKLIDEAYFNDSRILADGEVLELNRSTMIKGGCSVYNVLGQIHPSYIKIAEELANGLESAFVAVDIFINDFTRAPKEGNHWFIEYNTSPVLKLFYGCRDGEMVDIVPILADEIDAYLTDKHAKRDTRSKVVGGFEQVLFPSLHAGKVIAKVDTGAYSGAIHCVFIKSYRRADGVRVLRFQPFTSTNEIIETTDYKRTYIRSSTGHRVKRYIIETEVDIAGERYIIRTGLSDRRDMQTQVLIGRRFLRAYGMLVDVSLNEELDNDGGGK